MVGGEIVAVWDTLREGQAEKFADFAAAFAVRG